MQDVNSHFSMKTIYLEKIAQLRNEKPRVIIGQERETLEELMLWRDRLRTYENKLRSEK